MLFSWWIDRWRWQRPVGWPSPRPEAGPPLPTLSAVGRGQGEGPASRNRWALRQAYLAWPVPSALKPGHWPGFALPLAKVDNPRGSALYPIRLVVAAP